MSMENYSLFALNALKTFKMPPYFHIQYTEQEDFQLHPGFDYRLLTAGTYRQNLLSAALPRAPDRYLINHNEISNMLREDAPTIAVYNKSPAVFEALGFCSLYMIDQFGSTTQDFEECEEIVATNF